MLTLPSVWKGVVEVSFQIPLCEEVDGTGCYGMHVSVKIHNVSYSTDQLTQELARNTSDKTLLA